MLRTANEAKKDETSTETNGFPTREQPLPT